MAHELIIYVKRIKDQGLKLEAAVNPGILDLGLREFVFNHLVQVDVLAQFASKEILVKGVLETRFEGECARCLNPVLGKILVKDALFSYEFTGQDMIDISEDVRDEILLKLPSRVLCRETCKGICPECKVNLNDGSCSCPAKKLNSPFGVL